jgi:hypothetical protein
MCFNGSFVCPKKEGENLQKSGALDGETQEMALLLQRESWDGMTCNTKIISTKREHLWDANSRMRDRRASPMVEEHMCNANGRMREMQSAYTKK